MNSDHNKAKGPAWTGEPLRPNRAQVLVPAGETAAAEDGGGGAAREIHRQRSALPAHRELPLRLSAKIRREIPHGAT